MGNDLEGCAGREGPGGWPGPPAFVLRFSHTPLPAAKPRTTVIWTAEAVGRRGEPFSERHDGNRLCQFRAAVRCTFTHGSAQLATKPTALRPGDAADLNGAGEGIRTLDPNLGKPEIPLSQGCARVRSSHLQCARVRVLPRPLASINGELQRTGAKSAGPKERLETVTRR